MRLNWASHSYDIHEGYGRYALHSVRALAQQGVSVQPMPLSILDAPGWLQRLAGLDAGTLTIQCGTPDTFRPMPGRVWGLTMYEDQTRIAPGWADDINQTCERLLVPCEQNATLFRENGVRVPIHVVHGGTAPDEFPLLPYVPRESYTFLALGDRGARKGVEQVYSAFYQTFPADKFPDVRLTIKTRKRGLFGAAHVDFADRRVSVWSEDTATMADVFGLVDCFVFPSLGEGWGMPPREAVMSGIPTIVSRNTGLMVGIDHWATRVVERQHAQESSLAGGGTWLVPDVDEVGAHMMWCYEHRRDARDRAEQGAAWLRANQTWTHSAQALIQLVEAWR